MGWDHLARCALDHFSAQHPAAGVARSVIAGDPLAGWALRDILEEEIPLDQPFEIGKEYLVCTQTLYYVGRIQQAGFAWVQLEEASWVHWTGRLSVLLAVRCFKHSRFGTRNPRTEYVGSVGIATSSIVSYYGPPWKLPKEPVE